MKGDSLELFAMARQPRDQKYRSAAINPRSVPVSTFSYYGSKSKIVGRYQPPRHGLIIEPFGGSAAYAWRHHAQHDVWVNDINPSTVDIWRFLQSPDAADMLRSLPRSIAPGDEIEDIRGVDAHPGLLWLARAELSRGTAGRVDIPRRATAFGAYYYWPRLAAKFSLIAKTVSRWRVTCGSYEQIPNQEASWFIDPPYNNRAGGRYEYCDIDYRALGRWTRERIGQVVACENVGASWLPFERLTDGRIGHQATTTSIAEAVWMREKTA